MHKQEGEVACLTERFKTAWTLSSLSPSWRSIAPARAFVALFVCVCLCVCVCASVRERERDIETESVRVCVCACV